MQGVPSGLFGLEQTPPEQLPGRWHWSGSGQKTPAQESAGVSQLVPVHPGKHKQE
jgi:hypothetical protein